MFFQTSNSISEDDINSAVIKMNIGKSAPSHCTRSSFVTTTSTAPASSIVDEECRSSSTTAPSPSKSMRSALARMSSSSRRRLLKIEDEPPKRTRVRYLIEKKRWGKLYRYIATPHGAQELQEEPLALHMALERQAPLDMIQLLFLTNPECILNKDSHQRNALHTAAAVWAEPDTISYLIDINRSLVDDVDEDGRTPLHLLLIPTPDLESQAEWRFDSSYHSPSPIAIQHLVLAAPKIASAEDDDGMSPIEYALCFHDLPMCVIRLMRRASEKHWKNEQLEKRNETAKAAAAAAAALKRNEQRSQQESSNSNKSCSSSSPRSSSRNLGSKPSSLRNLTMEKTLSIPRRVARQVSMNKKRNSITATSA